MAEEGGENTIDTVQVALKIRPLIQSELDRGCDECIEVIQGEQQVKIKDLAFTYNYVFPQQITQQEFYDTAVKGLIGQLFQGYNLTILAYGQTGSGKTYTMGTNYSGSSGDSTKLGVIPQAVADIFNYIDAHKDQFTFKVNVCFMELYQEQCYDLLSGKERAHSVIEIREDINRGVILPGITKKPVSSTMETMMVLEQGSMRRVTGSTAMNQASSRSHAVFTMIISKESRTDKNIATTSKFHLVDLAGSERIKKTKAVGERLKEGVKINQGLLALGNVISALGDGTNRTFISYRDSKLTRLLQDSLGGNSLTLMVACVSPAEYNLDETVSTLRYADRARRIRNKPIINQDVKTAEIARLNNLVNELRLQLVGKLPSICEQNNEQLQEELENERSRYAELLKKHKHVTEHLSEMLVENTDLCEKALLAEEAKEKIEKKLNELTEQCNEKIENLNTVDNDTLRTSIVDYLKELKTNFEDLQSVNLRTNKELIDHEVKESSVTHGDNENTDEHIVLNEEQAVVEEEKRAIGQIALTQELRELNRAIAIKASVVQSMLANNKEMLESHANLRENEERIQHLEKERNELMQQLKQSRGKDPSHEERRNKASSLELEIQELKKKCQQQANVIKMKEKNEAKMAALNSELQAMKGTKIKIIRQMREESENFRKWKADNERAMLRMRMEDRKRANQIAKMESLHVKQQNVLKRKMEEAIAVNKRLKEALEKQKNAQLKRNAKGSVKETAIRAYIEQELEVFISVVDAEKSLEELMGYRSIIIDQLEDLRNRTDEEDNRKKIEELEHDLALRTAHISDFQQKILTYQENKTRTQWDNIQSMLEAKVALKCLFDLLIDTKRELQRHIKKGYQAKYEESKEAFDRLKIEFENNKSEFEMQLTTIKNENDQKLTALVAQRGVAGCGDRMDACRHLQNIIQYQQERLEQLEGEHKQLVEEIEQLRSNQNTKSRVKKTGNTKSKPVEYDEPSDDDDYGFSDEDGYLDFRLPMRKRTKPFRSGLAFSSRANSNQDTSSETSKCGVKRHIDGTPHCCCRGACKTKTCGCRKAGRGCTAACRCSSCLCLNRRTCDDNDDKENRPPLDTDFSSNQSKTNVENGSLLDLTYTKKKKRYNFFEDDSD